MYGYDRATGVSAVTASEMREDLATEIDECASADNAPVSSTKSQSHSQTRTKRLKLKNDEEQSSKLDESIDIMAGTFKDMVDNEKLPISVQELWGVINDMELDRDLTGDAFVFLLKRPGPYVYSH